MDSVSIDSELTEDGQTNGSARHSINVPRLGHHPRDHLTLQLDLTSALFVIAALCTTLLSDTVHTAGGEVGTAVWKGLLNEEVLVVAEGEGVRQYPREVLRERPVSAHRGTGGESLFIRGHNQPSIYTCREPVM